MASDVDHAHPEVREDLLNWGAWMMREFPISGFRFDAVKHMSRSFVCDFVKHVREETRKKRKDQGKEAIDESSGPIAFSVGEFWKDSVDSCIKYLNEFGDEQFSLFDAPLHYNFKEAGDGGKDYDLRKVFDGTIVQARPIDAVTLVENHDTQAGQALESVVPPNFKPLAYALILLRESGYPCVFLGDLDGCHGDGDHQPREPPMSSLDRLIMARKFFAYGEQHDYWDHPQCIGWVRTGDEKHGGCAVVLCNGDGEGKKPMQIGKAGEKWVDALGWKEGEIEINQDGWADFTCHPSSCSVWVRKEDKEKVGM
jgi:alpha-amylase